MPALPSYKYQFECVQCANCCKRPGSVYASDSELRAIADFLEITHDELVTRYFSRLDNGERFLEVLEGQACPFLKDEACQIHKVKPSQCRTYPFWPEIAATLSKWWDEAPHCPGIGQGKVYSSQEVREFMQGKRDRTE